MEAQTRARELVFSDFRTDGTWQVGAGATVSVAFTPDNPFPLVSFRVPIEGFSAPAWEAQTGKLQRTLIGCDMRVESVAFSPMANG
jgi:hypothetical protein